MVLQQHDHTTPHGHGTSGPGTHGHGAHDHLEGRSAEILTTILALDAEILHEFHFDVSNWVRGVASERPRRRILDLGAGSGIGTLALARRFPRAIVVAADVSPEMLAVVRDRAAAEGTETRERVLTVTADLGGAWGAPGLDGPFDLIWASSMLHEVPDPLATLREARSRLAPDGLVAVVEMDGPPRFLPDDLGPGFGEPGLEARIHGVVEGPHTLSRPSDGWAASMQRAGLEIVAERAFEIEPTNPRRESVRRYAESYLSRVRPMVETTLSSADRDALDRLLDDGPGGLRSRGDLTVRGVRRAWVGGAARRGEQRPPQEE